MEKEFVSYEIALKLKELNFNEPCAACYGSYVHKTSELFLNINNPVNIETLVREKTGFNRPTFYVKAPTYSQAFRWFREKYNIHNTIHILIINPKIYEGSVKNNLGRVVFMKEFTIYEEAELECLKKLIEIVTNKN